MSTRPVALAVALVLGLASGGPLASAQDAPRPRPDNDGDRTSVFVRPRHLSPGAAIERLLRPVEPPRLGVHVAQQPDGILVAKVTEDSLAAAAGVQEGDLLLSLDGERLERAEDIRRVLSGARPGSSLELSVVREGQGLVKLTVQLPEEPPVPDTPLADGHMGGFLGVELGEAGEGGGGVHVTGVIEGSAAWFAGLEADDVLVSIGGETVAGPEDVVGAVSSKAPGSLVALAWTRAGVQHETTIRLGRRPLPAGGLFPMVQPGANRLLPPDLPRGPGLQWRQQDLQDLHHGLRFRFFDGDDGVWQLGEPLPFDADAFGADLHERLEAMLEELSERLDSDLDLGDAQTFGIRIEDGKVTIERDGESETYDLDGAAAEEIRLQLPLLEGHLMRTPTSEGITTIRIRRDGCTAPCEGNTTETGRGTGIH